MMIKQDLFQQSRYLEVLCAQMYMAEKSGLPMSDVFGLLEDESKTVEEKAVFRDVAKDLTWGSSLADALQKVGKFPSYLVNTIHAGESTGKLENVLWKLERYYKRKCAVSESIRSAVFYPALMACLMCVVLVIIVSKVLPIFSSIFAQLGIGLSPVVEMLIYVGNVLPGLTLMVLAIAVVVVWWLLSITARGECHLFDNTSIAKAIACSDAFSVASMMLSSGDDICAAMQKAGQMSGNISVASEIGSMVKKLGEGCSFAESMEESSLLDGYSRRFLAFAEKSGCLSYAMEDLAENLGKEATAKVDSVIASIEPVVVIVLSAGAGFILLSVMLPLLGILSSIG